MNIFSTISKLPRRYLIGGVVIVVVAAGLAYLRWGRPAPSPYETTIAHTAPMEQIVSVTGKVKAQESVDLAFSVSGRVASVDAHVGQQVSTGAVLARLDASDLSAQLAQAQAQVDAAQAALDGLKAGAQPADIAASQAAADKAKQDLTNMYASIGDTSVDSYAKANDAVRTQVDVFFSNGDTQTPKLTYITANSQAQIDAEAQRSSATVALNTWQGQLTNIDQSNAGLETLLQSEISYLATIRQLLNSLSKTLDLAPALTASTLVTYKADVSAALNEVNTAAKNLNTISQNIASQKIAVKQLQSQLDLKRASATPEDIAAQEAQVKAAKANVQTLQAQLGKTVLRAPFSGLVTRQDAKLGATATANATLVSLSSQGAYEVEAYVPEADIAKVAVGNSARVTLDAYGDTVPFTATVLSIDPAETVLEGVSTYKVVLSLASSQREVKSGMTANVDIVTATRESAISVPARAVYQSSGKSYVKILHANGTTEAREVTTGIQGADGSVELISGVKDGESVVTYTNK